MCCIINETTTTLPRGFADLPLSLSSHKQFRKVGIHYPAREPYSAPFSHSVRPRISIFTLQEGMSVFFYIVISLLRLFLATADAQPDSISVGSAAAKKNVFL